MNSTPDLKRIKEDFKITGYEFASLRRLYGDSTYDLKPVLNISQTSIYKLELFKNRLIPMKYSMKLVEHWNLKKGKELEEND